MTETELQRAIKKALESAGVWVIRMGVSAKRGKRGTQSGEPGMPDLHLPGLGWFEVKLPGEYPSKDQLVWHAKASFAGVRVATVHSVLSALATATLWQIEDGKRAPLAKCPTLRVVK